jgi:mycothiol system anti-sigma-R factor
MACTDDGVDCDEVLSQVYEYLHQELDSEGVERVQQHLDACGFCLRQYGLEREVQDLIARSCGCSPAPENLRRRIIERITQVRVSGGGATATGTFYAETSYTSSNATMDPER